MIKNLAIILNALMIILAAFLVARLLLSELRTAIQTFFLLGVIPAASIAYIKGWPQRIRKFSIHIVAFNLLMIITIMVYAVWPASIPTGEFVRIFLLCILLSIPFILNAYLILYSKHMKKLILTKLILPKSEIDKLGPQEKKRYIMFTCMVRDLNLLQKCLLYINNENPSDAPSRSAKATIGFFFLKTLISKIHEMWRFLNENKILDGSTSFSKKLNNKRDKIKNFFSDDKVKDIFYFIRNKFGFHYEYKDDIDVMIEDASQKFSEFEIWLSDDSTNEIFTSSNAVILEVIFSEMKRLGFSGDSEGLLDELLELALSGARLFREFSVDYLVEAFSIKWEPQEEVEIEAPQLSSVKLPLIVS